MSTWFRNLKIRYKLLYSSLLTIVLLISIVIVALFGQFYIQTSVDHVLHTDSHVALLTLQVQRETFKALSRGKDYLLNYRQEGFERANIKYVNQVKRYIDTAYVHITEIKEADVHDEEHVQNIATIHEIEQALLEHKQVFSTLVTLLEKRGFKETGIEGEFRKKVHAIENAISTPEFEPLTVIMLTMRRHEKDYLLRKEEQYIQLLHEEVNHFHAKLKEMNLSPEQQVHLDSLATEYHDTFEQLIQVDAEITAYNEVYHTHNLEPLLQKIHDDALASMTQARTDIETVVNTVVIILLMVGVITIVIGIAIALALTQSLVKPLTLIVRGAQALTIGDMTLTGINRALLIDTATRRDEMGEIGRLADYFKEVVADIVRVSQGLADGNLKVMPQADYRGEFASIKNSLQTSLPSQQRVIEDIIQVSQGLANGELQIRTQGKYRGDFIQIKEALETALTSLQEVISDIVRVTQGLAEGNTHITPQVHYRGDFIQIKEALETAIEKLADATAQNVSQNWLKNGQAQLNNHMSGEQDFTTLAKNVITYCLFRCTGGVILFARRY